MAHDGLRLARDRQDAMARPFHDLSGSEIHALMMRGRQLRSQAAHDLIRHVVARLRSRTRAARHPARTVSASC